jgi:Ca-activated chloride channel homolog
MHYRNSRVFVHSGIAVLIVAAALSAQVRPAPPVPVATPAPGAPPAEPTVFRLDTRVVVCHATVVDKSGHLVTTLPREAFTVFENGAKQEIRVFKREDLPVSMGIVIDNSGSMRNKIVQVKAASVALVDDSNHDDEVFVVNFNDTAYMDLPEGKEFTNNIKELETALARIDTRGGTAMRDAIQMSIEHLKKAHKDKKVLVVVTDGNDNSSLVGMEALMKAARQSGVMIYAVGLLTEEEHREAARAKKALNDLTEATGGSVFYPKDVSEVDRIAHQVAHDIRNQYTIAYSPANSNMDGTFRQIRITAKAPGSPVVRTRTGYYATPDSGSTAGKLGFTK